MLFSAFMSMRRGRVLLLLASLVMGASARGQTTGGIEGTMPEDFLPGLKTLLANAWKQSPQTIEKELELAQHEARRYVYDSARLPQAQGWFDYARNETAVSGDNSTRTSDSGGFYRLEMTQSLFRWGELRNRPALGRLNVLIAEREYAEVYRQLATVLRQSYLDLIARKAALRHARLVRQNQESDFKALQERSARGEASAREMENRQLGREESALHIARLEEDFATMRRTLARVAGLKDFPAEDVPDEIPRPAYSETAAKELLAQVFRDEGKSTFEAEVHMLRAHEADLSYRIARVRLLPKFELMASYRLENTTNAAPGFVTQTGVAAQTIAVRAHWSIFDGFATRGEKRGALERKRYWERRTQSAADKTLDDAQALERRVAFDAKAVELTEARLALAQKSEAEAREELGRERTSQNAVDAATANRYANEVNTATVRANFFARWSEFVALAGVDPVLKNLPARYVREKR